MGAYKYAEDSKLNRILLVMANEQRTAHVDNWNLWFRIAQCSCITNGNVHESLLGRAALKVKLLHAVHMFPCKVCILESRSLEVERKMDGWMDGWPTCAHASCG